MRPLSYQQRMFVEYYLGDSEGSAADAARRAGYRCPETLGPRLAKRSSIRAAIDAGLKKAGIAPSEVLARIAELATADLLDFVEVGSQGECKLDIKVARRRRLGHLVKRLHINKDGSLDIVLESRLPALVKLGEHFNLWKSQAQQQITLVELSKQLRAHYEELQRTGECGEALEDLPG